MPCKPRVFVLIKVYYRIPGSGAVGGAFLGSCFGKLAVRIRSRPRVREISGFRGLRRDLGEVRMLNWCWI